MKEFAQLLMTVVQTKLIFKACLSADYIPETVEEAIITGCGVPSAFDSISTNIHVHVIA